MNKKLYVGNLPYAVNDHKLREIFQDCGQIETAQVIVDKFSGNSKGFGFVEMSNEEEAKTAVERINEKEIDGRKIVVNEAKPMEKRHNKGKWGGKGHGDKRGGKKNFSRGWW